MAQKQLLYSNHYDTAAIEGRHRPFHAADLASETPLLAPTPPPCPQLRTTTPTISSSPNLRKRPSECTDREIPHSFPPGEMRRTFPRQQSIQPLFAKGNRVEVQRPPSCLSPSVVSRSGGAFYPATVVSPPTRSRNEVLVEYHTVVTPPSWEHPQEYVDRSLVRPVPPIELRRFFKVGDSVDAYYEDAWRQGVVVDVCKSSRLAVFLKERGEKLDFAQFHLRLRKEWIDGRWVPPRSSDELPQNEKSNMELSPQKIKLKIRIGKKKEPVPPIFKHGQTVEVTSDQVGFEGSWYTARISSSLGNEKYVVEYRTLLTDDESGPLHEETSSSYIRPSPPHLPQTHFERLDHVDAWFNDGWWEGVITKVMKGQIYVVYFRKSHEELVFPRSKLRVHQDWIDGKWVTPSSSKEESNLKLDQGNQENTRGIYGRSNPDLNFKKGMKVEIRSDQDRFGDFWYTAEIIDSVRNDTYLVEYQTMRNNDETIVLRQEIAAQDIRSCPPHHAQQIYPFALFEAVDAWYNNGWWTGYISQILNNSIYKVYFRSTHESMVFNHLDLRPHRDWIFGQWVSASKVTR